MAGVGPARRARRGAGADDQAPTGLALRKVEEADAQVRASHGEAAGVVFDVGGRRFECLARQLLAFIHRAFAGHAHRGAAGEQRPAARAAKAVGAIRITLQHADAVQRHAKDIVRQLHVARRDALAHGHGGAGELDETIGGDVHAHVLFQCIATGPLQEGGDAAAAQLAARLGLRTPRLEALPVGQRQALVQDLLESAAVVDLRHRVLVRKLLGPDHVAAAQLGPIQPHLARGGVHQALDDVDGLGPARAAIGAGGRVVGQDGADLQAHAGDVVDAGADPRPDDQRNGQRRVGGIGTHIGQRAHTQRQHLAARIQRQFGMADLAAAMRGGQEVLHPLGLPLHRALELQRRVAEHDVFRVDAGLHAEAAAHVADQHAHGVLGEAGKGVNQTKTNAAGHLAAQTQRQAALFDIGQHAARLHRHRRHALVDDVQRHAVRGSGKRGFGGLGVAMLHLGRDVVRRGRPHSRCAGRGGAQRVADRRQVFVVGHDGVDRSLGRIA